MNKLKKVHVSVPGRICLFGEHQDYLGLPVITAAINLRIHVQGETHPQKQVFIDLPDINDRQCFSLPDDPTELDYVLERDYFRSTFNVLRRRGLKMHRGIQCRVQGNIPINSGTSSSSALTIAWAQFLNLCANKPLELSAEEIAHLAYLAEVVEFGEPGGMMDHYTTALGGCRFIEFGSSVKTHSLEQIPGIFVLGDSQQAKDTKTILSRVKQGVLDAIQTIKNHEPDFNLNTIQYKDIHPYVKFLQESQMQVLEGALINRDITIEARKLFQSDSFQHAEFGRLLSQHHEVLDKKLKISTNKINLMLRRGIEAGALGGKINGSGGGGCMFVYAPDNPDRVARAIEDAGGKAYVVSVDEGILIH